MASLVSSSLLNDMLTSTGSMGEDMFLAIKTHRGQVLAFSVLPGLMVAD